MGSYILIYIFESFMFPLHLYMGLKFKVRNILNIIVEKENLIDPP